MIDKPFIHLLKSPYHHYLFDVNTNSIVRISKDLYHYLDCLNHDENCQFSEDIRCEYNTLKENGYLKTKRPNSIQSPFLNDLNYFLNYHMNMLTLQVTQECNFRCSYCSYTIGDGITQRGHHSIRMSWETAKKAIDFWSKRVRHTNEINLGFYGGEPLLEWPLIKKCVLYAKTKLEGKHITFNMTTNATLLTEEMARFFVDNHVRLTISLDGPKEIHDRNRRFAINGEGTFDAVMSKIEEMREKVKGFQDIININSVIDPCNDAKCIVDFFNHGIAEDVRPSNLLPPPGTTIYYPKDYTLETRKRRLIGYLCLTGIIDLQSTDLFSKNYVGLIRLKSDTFLSIEELPDICGHAGPCLPGIKRTFVDVYGNFYPCEKCSETNSDMVLGNIDTGFNWENIYRMANIPQITADRCINCWALGHCNICAVEIIHNGGNIRDNVPPTLCVASKTAAEKDLLDLIALQETAELKNWKRGERNESEEKCNCLSL